MLVEGVGRLLVVQKVLAQLVLQRPRHVHLREVPVELVALRQEPPLVGIDAGDGGDDGSDAVGVEAAADDHGWLPF